METYKAHETAVIDPGCTIGDGTHIWHFSHIMPGCTIGRNCNIGQNVVISPLVVLGNNVKVQNNVSVYTGVTWHRLSFNEKGIATCSESNQQYLLEGGIVTRIS